MKPTIITISRQFGSGGRSVAKDLAQRLGWDYYDKELVKQVAEKTGFDPNFVEEHGEFAASSSILSYAFPVQGSPNIMNGMSASDFLWCMQRDVILQLAQKGNCVIVGRCADYILREREDASHFFIYAPLEFRAERILTRYGNSEDSPQQRLKSKDKKRRMNYKHYTDRAWGAAENYDMTINSAKFGVERCADIILNALELG